MTTFFLICGMLVCIGFVYSMFVIAGSARPPQRADRLEDTVRVWLDDERPAWETIAAFERDVEKVMRGEQTEDYVERMPLRTRKIKAADGHKVRVREPHPGYTLGVKPKRCRHNWTAIPPDTVDALARLRGGRVSLPDMYAGRTVEPWCVKCRTYKDGRPVRSGQGWFEAHAERITPSEQADIDRVVSAVRRGRRR